MHQKRICGRYRYLRQGQGFIVKSEDQYSKCGWTPYEGECLKGFIEKVFVNGKAVVEDGKILTDLDENTTYGKLLKFSEL